MTHAIGSLLAVGLAYFFLKENFSKKQILFAALFLSMFSYVS